MFERGQREGPLLRKCPQEIKEDAVGTRVPKGKIRIEVDR